MSQERDEADSGDVKRGRGRPEHKPTRTLKSKVALGIAAGMSNDMVARAIGISKPTLEKYYTEEIETGRAMKIMENLLLIEKAAKKGNVTAQKHLDSRFEMGAGGGGPPKREASGKPPGGGYVGVKEIRGKEAHEPPSESSVWAGLVPTPQ